MCKDEQQIGEDQVSEAVGSLSSGQDPGIKLFGKVISACNGSENEDDGDVTGVSHEENMCPDMEFDDSSKEVQEQRADEDPASGWVSEELRSSSGSNSGREDGSNSGREDDRTAGEDLVQTNPTRGSPEMPVISNPCVTGAPSETDSEQHTSVKSSEETALRKPDKAVPCPRCESLDTKFCYFNNYNVNQPRHFCKQCQRYWTAGGTLRNVPVGAGRRKHKHPSLQQNPQQQSAFDSLTVRMAESDPAQQIITPSHPQPSHHQPVQAFLPILPERLVNSCADSKPDMTSNNNSHISASAFTPKVYSGSPMVQAMAIVQGKRADLGNGAFQSAHSLSTMSSEVSNGSKNNTPEEQSRGARQGRSSEEPLSGSCISAFPDMDRKEGEQQRSSLPSMPASLPVPAPVDPSVWQQRARLLSDAAPAPTGWMNTAPAAPLPPFCFFNGAWPAPYVFNPGWSAFPQSHVAAPFYNPSAAAAPTPAPAPTPASATQMMVGFNPWCHPSMWPPGSWAVPPVWTPTMPWEAAAAAVAAAAAAAAAASAISSGGSSTNLGKHPRVLEARAEGPPLWLPKTLRMDDQGEQVRSSILASLGLSDMSSAHLNLLPKEMQKSAPVDGGGGEIRHPNPAAASRSVAFQESN